MARRHGQGQTHRTEGNGAINPVLQGSRGGGESQGAPEVDRPRLTPEAEELLSVVRSDEGVRPPMPYRDHVLLDYRPGEIWHLSQPRRTKLHELGRTPELAAPPGTFARRHYDRFLLDLTCGSVALELEAPSYSRLEVQQLLTGGAPDPMRSATETQLILNHKRAIELLVDADLPLGLDRGSLCNLHAALAENLLPDPSDEGRLRWRGVLLPGTSLVPLARESEIAERLELLLERVTAIPDPFEQAFFLLLHLPYLHPFFALNEAVARVAANIPLVRANLYPMTWEGVPRDVYMNGVRGYFEYQKHSLLRDVFEWGYERSCERLAVSAQTAGEPDPIRLRYRRELHGVVREVVGDRVVADEGWLMRWGELNGVAADDRTAFAAAARGLLEAMHEGGIGRYGISWGVRGVAEQHGRTREWVALGDARGRDALRVSPMRRKGTT
ncbi:MAG: Fic family protein [Gemmatimonadetes bacterium]|nr:Fic family protein [Gemmatimonadota bacterium]